MMVVKTTIIAVIPERNELGYFDMHWYSVSTIIPWVWDALQWIGTVGRINLIMILSIIWN